MSKTEESKQIEKKILEVFPDAKGVLGVTEQLTYFKVLVYGPWYRANMDRVQNILKLQASKPIEIEPTHHF